MIVGVLQGTHKVHINLSNFSTFKYSRIYIFITMYEVSSDIPKLWCDIILGQIFEERKVIIYAL